MRAGGFPPARVRSPGRSDYGCFLPSFGPAPSPALRPGGISGVPMSGFGVESLLLLQPGNGSSVPTTRPSRTNQRKRLGMVFLAVCGGVKMPVAPKPGATGRLRGGTRSVGFRVDLAAVAGRHGLEQADVDVADHRH